MEAFHLLPDPQTNGGLLFSVKPSAVDEVKKILSENNLSDHLMPVGRFISKEEKWVRVCLHSNASI